MRRPPPPGCLLLPLLLLQLPRDGGAAAVYEARAARDEVADRGFHQTELSALLANDAAVASNVTIVDAGSYVPELPKGAEDQVVVYSSWALLALLYDGHVKKEHFRGLAEGLRDAVADSADVCRAAVRVVEMHAVNVDFVVGDAGPASNLQAHHRTPSHASFVNRLEQLMRGGSRKREHAVHHVNLTQIKASYEIRIFKEMRLTPEEVGHKIDRLQIYSHFSDLNRLLQRSLSSSDYPFADSVMVDDVGYGSKHVVSRPALPQTALLDCMEEGLLQDARRWHQSVVGISLVLVVLITCSGSVIFTLKHPSIVPSRMNPLMPPPAT